MLVCTKNLRIYNNISEYICDMDEYNKINPSLNTKISNMLNLSRINNELTNDVIDIDQEVF